MSGSTRESGSESLEALRELAEAPDVPLPLTFEPGTYLGPYELVSKLGAGGMGAVFRGRDARLGRDVAIKVLHPRLQADATLLERFRQEARAAGALNHPNVLAVYDIGTHEGTLYLVTELLDGETLRSYLRGVPLPTARVLEIGAQIARGLASAHQKGFVHRDLKPENVFVTREGTVKILDFGLAKLAASPQGTPLARGLTHPGTVLGTPPYMSPEQVGGGEVDQRADIFSLGAILYEMVEGRSAFRRPTPVEEMNAVLHEQPPPLGERGAFAAVIERCLRKTADERFESARDVAYVLEALNEAPAEYPRASAVRFRRLSFRRGTIWAGRFSSDGHTIVYSAAWDGAPVELFATRPESPNSRSLSAPGTNLLAISSRGEMAILARERYSATFERAGTLARVHLEGGSPKEVVEQVHYADWAPDGGRLAVVRSVAGRHRLELPLDNVLCETAGWMSHPRFSPGGDLIAYILHQKSGDDGGSVCIVDLSGRQTVLSAGWNTLQGLAWSPCGSEIWFTGSRTGSGRSIHAVDLSGSERQVYAMAGTTTLLDIARDGRVLLATHKNRGAILCHTPGSPSECDLSLLDWAGAIWLADDGGALVLCESGEGGGPVYHTYWRRTDGSPAVDLGEGAPIAVSSDGQWVLTTRPPEYAALALLPVGIGEPRQILERDWTIVGAAFLAGNRRVLLDVAEPGSPAMLHVLDLEDGRLEPLGAKGGLLSCRTPPVSADGGWVASARRGQPPQLVRIPSGEVRPLPGLEAGLEPLRWNADGTVIYFFDRSSVPAHVFAYDLKTGARTPQFEVVPPDPAGIVSLRPPLLTPDCCHYVYGYTQLLCDLYIAEGLE